MNFFEHQDSARKNTRWLMLAFAMAVFCLLLITNLFLTFFPWQMNFSAFSEQGSNHSLVCLLHQDCDFWASVEYVFLFKVSISVVFVITAVSLYKWFSLKAGGKKVAEMMGGIIIEATSKNIDEQRLINVVEEMALAANMPVPAVYVLPNEFGINAFAAGFSPKDAVIAVSQGALQSFNREQLQGVVAHEFSHILNGDMRLNMKIIAVLHGIMFITQMGHVFLRGTKNARRDRNGPTAILGFGLVVIGSLGTFFGLLIKAAISRQREFLADASAVQFTRYPQGISDALKVIGGASVSSFIHEAKCNEISHLFFGQALSWLPKFLATHPPLAERIRRLDPKWDGTYLHIGIAKKAAFKPNIDIAPVNSSEKLSALIAGVMIAEDNIVFKAQLNLHEPLQAAAAIACMFIQKEYHAAQHQLIQEQWPELFNAMQTSKWQDSARQDFLPIVELATSGLRSLSAEEYAKFKRIISQIIEHDGLMDIYEWALFYLLKACVDTHFGHAVVSRPLYKHPKEVAEEMRVVVSMLALAGSENEMDQHHAYDRGIDSFGIKGKETELRPKVTMEAFNLAVDKLTNAFPLLKSRIIKALVECVKADGRVELIERNTIMAIAAALDTPIFNLFE